MQTLFDTSIQQRLLMWPPPDANFANCSTAGGATTLQKAATITSAAGGITAAGAVAAGAAAGSVVPVVGTIVGIVAGLIGSIFGAHHAQAVAAQNNALCTAVPATNAALQQIDQGLAAGTLTPAQASGYYSQIQSQFTAAMKAGTSYKACDALYAYNLALEMVLAARQQDLAALQTSAGGAESLVAAAANATGLPPLALWGAAALALYALAS